VAAYIEEEHAQREAQQQGFPLHKYTHHGLSSQAMLFNLVGSLIVRSGSLAVTKIRHGLVILICPCLI